jgi:hypothetical protein
MAKTHFTFYHPENDTSRIVVRPPEEDFLHVQKHDVRFYNQTTATVEVYFPAGLRVAPLVLAPGINNSVYIDPTDEGVYPCGTRVLSDNCPTCGHVGKFVVRESRWLANLAPVGAGQGAPTLLKTAATGSLLGQRRSGDDDADPVIIIKP